MPNTDLNPQGGKQGTSYIYKTGTSANTRAAVSQKVRLLTPTYGSTTGDQRTQIGVVSSLSISESKTVDAVRGIGFGDMVAELIPGVTDPTTADLERTLMYLSNLWQSTGYAAGNSGPVRSLKHHKWPFDMEQQMVYSSLVDADLGVANEGLNQPTDFQGGVRRQDFAGESVSSDNQGGNPTSASHSAQITFYEGCWFTSYSVAYAADSGMIAESGSVTISDVHDLSSTYGEFLATGNDPTIGQLGSIRFDGAGTP